MKREILISILICAVILMGCNVREESASIKLDENTETDQRYADDVEIVENDENFERKNEFFYEMSDDEKQIQVLCELKNHGGDGTFKGTAILQIERIEQDKKGNYYSLTLTDLNGTCSMHSVDDLECVYCGEFRVGYFYVDAENVYQMNYSENFQEIFEELESFPPTEEYVENYNQCLKDAGEHYGYFDYELVCTVNGVDDTYKLNEEGFESLPQGVLNYNYGEQKYHNYIKVSEEEIKYNLYPEEITGSDMYKYITWHKNVGIVSYSSWSDECNRYIFFSLEDEN